MEDDKTTQILEGPISRTILRLSAPVILSNVFQITYNLVDTYYVGQLGPDAIAAVTLGFPFIFLIWAVAGGISIGITSATARFLGARKIGKASEVATHGITLALIMTAVMMAIGYLTLETMIHTLGASNHVLDMSWDYVSLIIVGTGFVFLGLAASGIIRAEGNMIVPMYALIGGTVLNIILDPIFIYGHFGFPRMEVQGAALATVVSQYFVMMVVMVYLFYGKRMKVRVRMRRSKLRRPVFGEILRVGAPSTVNHLMIAFGVFIWAAFAAAHSDEALAALGLGFRLNSVAFMPALGMNVAIITIVGQNVGAGNFDRVKQTVQKGILMAAVYMLIIVCIYVMAPRYWISFFTNDEIVISHATNFLYIVTMSYIFLAASIVISGAFQGSGIAVPPMVIMAVRMLVVAGPVAYVLMFIYGYGATGLWVAIALSNLFSAVVSAIWFARGSWKKGHSIIDRASDENEDGPDRPHKPPRKKVVKKAGKELKSDDKHDGNGEAGKD